MLKKWRCTVCGYVHEGAKPPEICPVCGVGPELFVLVDQPRRSILQDLMQSFQPHVFAVHFPSALIPTLLLFAVIAVTFTRESFDRAVFYLLVVVLVTAPAGLVTGIREWRTKFDGRKAPIFRKKIGLAVALISLCLLALTLRLNRPDLLLESGSLRAIYLLLLFTLVGCVALLGHYGGKLLSSLMQKK